MDNDQIEELYYEQANVSTDYEQCECSHTYELHDEDGCACCACEGFVDP